MSSFFFNRSNKSQVSLENPQAYTVPVYCKAFVGAARACDNVAICKPDGGQSHGPFPRLCYSSIEDRSLVPGLNPPSSILA